MGTMSEPIFESVTTMEQVEFERWIGQHLGPDRHRYELLNGRVVMNPPAGWPHGEIEANVVRVIGTFVRETAVGKVFGSSQGFELPTGDTLEPDVTFVSNPRWEAGPAPTRGRFLRVVPDLVVEILSASTASRDRGEKKAAYAAAGVREYWLVDERASTLTIFHLQGARFDRGEILGEQAWVRSRVLVGMKLRVGDLF